MANYIKVKKVPKEIDDVKEMVIDFDFKQDILSLSSQIPDSKTMTNNFCRLLLGVLGDKYVSKDYDSIVVNITPLLDRPFKDVEHIEQLIFSFCEKYQKEILNGFVEYHVVNRKHGIENIYFLGDHLYTQSFDKHGIKEKKQSNINKKGK